MDEPLHNPIAVDAPALIDALRRRETQRKKAFAYLVAFLGLDVCVLLVVWLIGYEFEFGRWIAQLFSIFSLTSASIVFWFAVARLVSTYLLSTAWKFRYDVIVNIRRWYAFCELVCCMKIVTTDADSWPDDDSVVLYFTQMAFIAFEVILISILSHRVQQVDNCHERIAPPSDSSNEAETEAGHRPRLEFSDSNEPEPSTWAKFKILKPYFWPSTPPYILNRIRAVVTWVLVGISKCVFQFSAYVAGAIAVSTTSEDSLLNVWIPVDFHDSLKFFNPRLRKLADHTANPTYDYDVSLLQLASKNELKSNKIVLESKRSSSRKSDMSLRQDPAPQAEVPPAIADNSGQVPQTEAQQEAVDEAENPTDPNSPPAVAAALPPVVGGDKSNATPITPIMPTNIVHDDKACLPKCQYECEEPECLQLVEPDCEIPKCQTRCPEPSAYYDRCKVQCNKPKCMLTCPKEQYNTEVPYAENMTRPVCTTKCDEPSCALECDVGMDCESICEEPKCKWKSKDPIKCPKPLCALHCEQAKSCYKGSYDLPAVNKSHTMVKQEFKAAVAAPTVGEWGECIDGFRHREVTCDFGEGNCGELPAANEPCVAENSEEAGEGTGEPEGSSDWIVGEWGECIGRCDSMVGHHKRNVSCPHEDRSLCKDKRPHRTQSCNMTAAVCDLCTASLSGDGWAADFSTGDYDEEAMDDAGVDFGYGVKTFNINGKCCRVEVFWKNGFGGESVVFPYGGYSWDQMHSAGVPTVPKSLKLAAVDDCDTGNPAVLNTGGWQLPWWFWLLGGSVVVTVAVCNIMGPIFLARTTTELTHGGKMSAVIQNIVLYCTCTFSAKFFNEAQSLVYIKVQQTAYIELQVKTYHHLFQLPLEWHLKKKLGQVIRAVDRGIQAANSMMKWVFLYTVPTLFECFAVMVVFTVHFDSYRLAVWVFMMFCIYAYSTYTMTLWRKKHREKGNTADNRVHELLSDALTNYESVKVFTNEQFEEDRYAEAISHYQENQVKIQFSLSALNIWQQAIIATTTIGGLIMSAYKVRSGELDVGGFVAVNVYILQLFTPLSFLGTIYGMIINSLVDMQTFATLLEQKYTVTDVPNAPNLALRDHSVEFKDVNFRYKSVDASHTQPGKLENISFFVESGSSCAIIGSSGAGKTTVSRLLLRFYDPDSGMIRVGGTDIKSVTQISLRAHIGVVPQDVVLFNDTIVSNIQYGDQNASIEKIHEAAKAASLLKFIEAQPEKFETVVGERGLRLSGGEKQRLAIARCLLKNPPIVLLDEATSALDSETEAIVQAALNTLRTGRTVISIAHRLSTIKKCNLIVVMEHGRIVERGNHEELLTAGGRYADFWLMQSKEGGGSIITS
eukprot:gene977-1154_t